MIVRHKKTISKYGTEPDKRSIKELLEFGGVVIDKPAGPTSHQVAAYVQQILSVSKAGHGGTLDPKVTGVLVVATNKASRLLEYMLTMGKEYVGVMHLHDDFNEYEIRKTAEQFVGVISQLPPKRSAVARRVRQREIYSLRILEVRGRDVLFSMSVQAGTYVRKFCHDFGKFLKSGAHMAELRRTRAGPFTEQQAVTLQQLTDAYNIALKGEEDAFRSIFMPAEKLVDHLPEVIVLDSAVNSLTNGASLKIPGIQSIDSSIKKGDLVRLMTQKGELIATGYSKITAAQIHDDKGIAVSVDKVFMSSNVYPRMQ